MKKMSRFLLEKDDKLLSLHLRINKIMTVIEQIRKKVQKYPDDFVFTVTDIGIETENVNTQVQALNRMLKAGELAKLSKGRFYKPRRTQFGLLKPSAYQISKEFLIRNGKLIGYVTGISAFNALGLTTQISSFIQIGTNKYRQSVNREGYTISFVVQPNIITKKNIEILRILDAIRFIREIPGTTPNEACLRIIEIVRELDNEKKQLLVKCALKYTNYVRALCGAILEEIGCSNNLFMTLKKSLNGVTEYKLPIKENVLSTKTNWRIYEPTRK